MNFSKHIAISIIFKCIVLVQGSMLCAAASMAQIQPHKKGVDSIPQIVHLEDSTLVESSGLAFSRKHKNILYTHEDSKCANKITAFDIQGKTKAAIWLTDVANRDWEDIAVIPASNGKSYIYLADIGDNAQQYAEIYLYRIEEPSKLKGEIACTAERITLRYPQAALNAETLLFDPWDNSLWIVTKEKESAGLYRIPSAALTLDTDRVLELEKVLEMPFTKITAGDISRDGKQVLLRNKAHIYGWKRAPKEPLSSVLARQPFLLKHRPEHQSEGITFDPKAKGFVTSTEIRKKSGLKPYISIYRFSGSMMEGEQFGVETP